MNLLLKVWGCDDGVELTPVYCDYSIMKVLGRRVATRGERGVSDAIWGFPCRKPYCGVINRNRGSTFPLYATGGEFEESIVTADRR